MESNNDLLPLLSDTNERFRRIRELGSGTYGRVLLALDRDLQQRCALKILSKSTTKYRDFQREYNYSLLLSPHRSIISTYEDRCYQTADAFVIVQEYAPLGDLFESIPPQRGLPEKAVKTIMKQVASALEFMHDKGLVSLIRLFQYFYVFLYFDFIKNHVYLPYFLFEIFKNNYLYLGSSGC
jgi:serine/threonine protein kinase